MARGWQKVKGKSGSIIKFKILLKVILLKVVLGIVSQAQSQNLIIPTGKIEQSIVSIRGKNVMLDYELAELYQVETKVLNQAVKRNIERFPEDFMFQLSKAELEQWRSQIVTSNPNAKMALRRSPYAFTEQSVAMLSGVLKSQRAIKVNVAIIRIFVRIREMLSNHEGLAKKLKELEQKYDRQFRVVFDAIHDLMEVVAQSNRSIGYQTIEKD